MAFSCTRGRPPKPRETVDYGTPELRLKHSLRITSEPIDLCLEVSLITPRQHWCAMHLRWLYTLRYGAPKLSTHYTDQGRDMPPTPEDPLWRSMREREYHEAAQLLKTQGHYEPIMRIAIFNEVPAFLATYLRARAGANPALGKQLSAQHTRLQEGLEMLVNHWKRGEHSVVQ